MHCEKAADDGLSMWATTVHMVILHGVLGSWPQAGLALVVEGMGSERVNGMEDFSLCVTLSFKQISGKSLMLDYIVSKDLPNNL